MEISLKKKYLLAVSGGPDSMFMLNKYKKKSIVVAHVNYHKREDSSVDENIVRAFCAKWEIPFEVMNVKEEAKINFQAWARDIRYKFFKEVMKKYHCEVLLTAHHMDDFLETAIMQMESKRVPRYYGIRTKHEINGLKVMRPFIDLYWKEEIIAYLKKHGIEYATDYTNKLPLYTRNKTRTELEKLSLKEKQSRFSWFTMSNKILKKKFKRVDHKLAYWKSQMFDLETFRKFKRDQEEVAYEYIHNEFGDVKVSKGKLEGLVAFIEGIEGGKSFEIDSKNFIRKEKGFLIVVK